MKLKLKLLGVLLLGLMIIPTVFSVDTDSTDDADAIFDLISSTSEQFKDAELVTVFDHIVTEYADSGAAVTEEEVLLHFRKGSAASSMRSLHYEYNPRTANIEFLVVRIYRAKDQTVEEIPAEEIFIEKAPADSIFWNFDAVVCPIPRLKDGDALYYKIKRQGLNLAYLHEITDEDFKFIPPQEGYFMDTLYFQERHPLIEKTYDITGPKSKPLQFTMANGSLNSTVRFTENQWQYTFSVENVAAWQDEPFDDGFEETALKLALASHPSWESKSKWAFEHNEPQFIISDEIREKTMEVISGCDDDYCKMFRLLHWVAEEIRYLGLDMGEGEGHMVHTTDTIFTERAGVCKDKAAILVSMLRAAGFESYFVMTLAMEKTLDLPADDKFNHGVVAVRNDDGSWTFLDPTWAPQNRPLFNYSEQEQPVLIAAPEGVDLMHVPYSPPHESPFVINAETTLNQNGSATIEMFIETDGFVDGRFRSLLSWMTPSFRTQYFQNLMTDLSPLAEMSHMEFSHPLDFDQPLQMKFVVTIPEAAQRIGDTLYLNPLLTRHLWNSRWNSRYLHADKGPKDRQHGLELACTRHVEFHETVHLPSGFELKETPDKIDIKGDTIDTTFEVNPGKRGVITIDQSIDIKRRVTPAKEYPAVRKTIETLNEIRETVLVLQSTGKAIKNPRNAHVKGTVKPHNLPMLEHGATIHDRQFEITFEENRIIERFRTESTVYTDDGRTSMADNSYIYLDDSQTVEVIEAYTINPEGVRIDVPESAINRTLAYEVYDAPDYKKLKTLMVSHIGVEYGSRLIHEVVRTTDLTDTDSASNFQTLFTPAQEYPVDTTSFVVNVPTEQDIVFETSKVDAAPVIREANGIKTYKWSFDNVSVPISERNMGSYYATVPLILVAGQPVESWEAQVESLQSILFDQYNQELLKSICQDIIKDSHTGREKITAIVDYVNSNINSVEIRPRRFLYRTRKPAEVLNSGYGYSLDKARLINALIEVASGQCFIGFGGSRHVLESNVPTLRMMSDICYSLMLDGDHIILDGHGTPVQMSRWIDKRNLWIGRSSHFWQEPVSPDNSKDIIRFNLDLNLAEKDVVSGSLDVAWSGLLNTGAKAQSGTDAFIKRVVSNYVSEVKISRLNVLSLDVTDGITRIQCNFDGTLKLDSLAENIQFLTLPTCPYGFASDRYRLSQRKDRHHPFHLVRSGSQKEQIRVTWPNTLKAVKLPRPLILETDAGNFTQSVDVDDNSLVLRRSIEYPHRVLAAEDYTYFLQLHGSLTNEFGHRIYFSDGSAEK